MIDRFRDRLRRWLTDRENLLFAVLIVLHLIPIWSFKYFPSQDGPAHINNANVLREYYRPDLSVFREYYLLNRNPEPNWFGHLVLAGLMNLMPMLVAEKILLSGYVILLPFSIRYAVSAICPDSGFLAILAFPFIYNYLFHLGLYNFSYSLALFFFVVGYWVKHQSRFTLRRTVTLTTLVLLLYFCHLVSLVTTYVAIALLTIWLTLLDIVQQVRERQFNLGALWTVFRGRALAPLCALLLPLILVAMFLNQKGHSMVWNFPLWAKLWELRHLASLISYDQREGWFVTAFIWLFVAVFAYLIVSKVASRGMNSWDGFLLVVSAYIVIYLTGPHEVAGGGMLTERMNLYPFLALILWFGAQSYSRTVRRTIQIIAAGIALSLLGLHATKYAELNDYLEEYLSGAQLIEPNTTLLPLSFSHRGYAPDGRILSLRVGPFLHASGHIAAQRRIVELDNFAAWAGWFPIIFRPNLNPRVHIGIEDGFEGEPPRVDFLTYPQRTGGRVDYVLVWGIREIQHDHPYTQSIFRHLEKGYHLIYTSPQRGFMQLYRRKDFKETGDLLATIDVTGQAGSLCGEIPRARRADPKHPDRAHEGKHSASVYRGCQ